MDVLSKVRKAEKIFAKKRLIMCCSYYQAHLPNKYFNKYQIGDWYDEYCRDERKIVEDRLAGLRDKYSIHFPDRVYTIDLITWLYYRQTSLKK